MAGLVQGGGQALRYAAEVGVGAVPFVGSAAIGAMQSAETSAQLETLYSMLSRLNTQGGATLSAVYGVEAKQDLAPAAVIAQPLGSPSVGSVGMALQRAQELWEPVNYSGQRSALWPWLSFFAGPAYGLAQGVDGEGLHPKNIEEGESVIDFVNRVMPTWLWLAVGEERAMGTPYDFSGDMSRVALFDKTCGVPDAVSLNVLNLWDEYEPSSGPPNRHAVKDSCILLPLTNITIP